MMRLKLKSTTALVFLGLVLPTTAAGAHTLQQNASLVQSELLTISQTLDNTSKKSFIKVLSDHPGSATALTPRQKSEIRQILAKAKGNSRFICTAASLAGQRESMYPVVLLRAQLVCAYAKSVDSSITTTVQEKTTATSKFNGRVVVVSK